MLLILLHTYSGLLTIYQMKFIDLSRDWCGCKSLQLTLCVSFKHVFVPKYSLSITDSKNAKSHASYIHMYTFLCIYKQGIMILSLRNTSSCICTYAECHFIAVCTCSKFPIHSQNRTKNDFMMLQLKSKMVLALDFTLESHST
mgnify:CR=1 FL=1